MDALGLSYRQLRERLDALAAANGILDGQVRQGPRNKSEYTPAVLEMLREMDQLARDTGSSLADAAIELAGRMKENTYPKGEEAPSNGNGKGGTVAGKSAAHGEVTALQHVITMQAEEIQWLRGQVERLQDKVDELLPLALPAPKKRWWGRLVGR